MPYTHIESEEYTLPDKEPKKKRRNGAHTRYDRRKNKTNIFKLFVVVVVTG
jgi:hypothetical protein